MRTGFSSEQLQAPHLSECETNLRKCVHCGICTATCPTYVLLGDERDSPRGRIVMMQQMLEEGGPPSPQTVHHVDRCLSCLACSTACPSSVDYRRLVDQARAHIETHHIRPRDERVLRWFIANVMTRPLLAGLGLFMARNFVPLARLLPEKFRVMAVAGATTRRHAHRSALKIDVPAGARAIALMPGCAQKSLAPQIDKAVARVLARRGLRLVPLAGAGCCGALGHHLGRDARGWAKRAIMAFEKAGGAEAFEAILISATGCSAHLKDLAHLFIGDAEWEPRAQAFAAKVRDFCEIAAPRAATPPRELRIAYHAACSLQHGLKLGGAGEALLEAAGFTVLSIPEGHLCCGSAGSYSILQPDIAGALRNRKLANIATLEADAVVSGNIGCLSHLAGGDAPPFLHLAEILDWAEGGPEPMALAVAAR